MSDNDTDTEYRAFVQSVIDNVKKNGFPGKKVAFPLEQMYEIAEKKGISFNKVLATLDEIQIAHKKTPEKIIFYPKDREPQPQPQPQAGANPTDAFSNMAANINPEMFKNMDMSDMMTAASQMMQNLNPEQLEAVKNMYENMSDEERAAMIEQVKKMGMF
ncbi:MAG: hypothetical protein GY854_31700 [Deltaproteobacteria bacterium]|nr:hypothetical protein [Deltaproteobacteria bacterium]